MLPIDHWPTMGLGNKQLLVLMLNSVSVDSYQAGWLIVGSEDSAITTSGYFLRD
jgi:hypothetical protein